MEEEGKWGWQHATLLPPRTYGSQCPAPCRKGHLHSSLTHTRTQPHINSHTGRYEHGTTPTLTSCIASYTGRMAPPGYPMTTSTPCSRSISWTIYSAIRK